MKVVANLISVFFIIIACNSNNDIGKMGIRMEVTNVSNSPYESEVKMVEVELINTTSDTLLIERRDKMLAIVADRVDNNINKAIVYFPSTNLKNIVSDFNGTLSYFPDILISDSASKLFEYYNEFSGNNNKLPQSKGFYKLAPKTNIHIGLILHFSGYDLYQINENALDSIINIQLVLNLKILKKTQGRLCENKLNLYSNNSEELKKIFHVE